MLVLTEAQCVDPDTGVHCNWHNSMLNISRTPHAHEFYEIFMLTEGDIVHVVNGQRCPLQEGSLVLIRPQDAHTYDVEGAPRWRLVNLTFSREVINGLLNYLGIDRGTCPLLTADMPPHLILPEKERAELVREWQSLTAIPRSERQQVRQTARTIIADLVLHRFLPSVPMPAAEKEGWFERLTADMRLPENYIAGVSRLKELAPCSYEHVCRTFRRAYGRSPSAWINEQRLNYAANQLACTDKPILELISEAGFDNPSYFYALFKKHYAVAPLQFRTNKRRTVIP